MKNILILFLSFLPVIVNAQLNITKKTIPHIQVIGVGKYILKADEASLTISIESTGTTALEAQQKNNADIEKAIKSLDSMNFSNFKSQAQKVELNRYRSGLLGLKDPYVASQQTTIILTNFDRYDDLVATLLKLGIYDIKDITLTSYKIQEGEAEARKAAVENARIKADNFAKAANMKAGRIIKISDEIFSNSIISSVQYARISLIENPEIFDISKLELLSTINITFALEK